MKLGIVLQSNNPERIWNTLRLASTALEDGHAVQIFLLSEGVEVERVTDTEQFDISVKLEKFKSQGGTLQACGTCLETRGKSGPGICPIGTMQDLLVMIEASDKVLVFG